MIFTRRKWTKTYLFHEREREALTVVGDAAIASPLFAEGRLVPLVILDTTKRPDLEEHIRLHQFSGPGDVRMHWGRTVRTPEDKIALILTFSNPSELIATIEFEIGRQGVVVEQILNAHALYIQGGKPGDRLVHDLERPKIIVEIPDTGFRPHWDKMYFKAVYERIKAEGLNRHDAKRAAKNAIEEMKKLGKARVPTARSSPSAFQESAPPEE